jgi:two-component system response regulator PilR (NtrC family)
MAKGRVLVVDDDLSMRQFLSILLQREGYLVDAADSAEAALSGLAQSWPDLVLSDVNMPGMTGLELLVELKRRGLAAGRGVEVVLVTAYGTANTAVEAMKAGAADYVLKPFNNDELLLVVRRALARRDLEIENEQLKRELKDKFHFGQLIGNAPAMMEVYELIRRVKDTRINCLLVGESGTGKELVARAIHHSGPRADRAFTAVNCGAIPEGLVESTLFGHRRGAFTGADRDREGLLQAAHRGTLFLDEVNSLPLSAQVKLLRVLQERRFTPVGETREQEVDVRVVAASNAHLEDLVKEGQFREDLYYRLNVVQLRIPPLRDRVEDIPVLVRHFIREFAAEYEKPVHGISPEALDLLRAWSFPGNVRELRNTVERAVALCAGGLVLAADLPAQLTEPRSAARPPAAGYSFPEDGVNLDALMADMERGWLTAALDAAEGNKTQAARLLQMSFRSFRYRLAKYDLDTPDRP